MSTIDHKNRIDHKNVDEYLFNFFEGNLSAPETDLLKSFLNKNPSLKADYDAWKASYVEEPPVAYPNAGQLLQKVPATAMKKWIGRGLALMVVLGLLIFFLMPEHVMKERSTKATKGQSTGIESLPQRKSATPSLTGKEKNVEEQKKWPDHSTTSLQHANNGISAEVIETAQAEPVAPFLMQPKADEEVIDHRKSGAADSLEILLKLQPVSHPAGKSTKQKTRKKPMTVIRIRDTGF